MATCSDHCYDMCQINLQRGPWGKNELWVLCACSSDQGRMAVPSDRLKTLKLWLTNCEVKKHLKTHQLRLAFVWFYLLFINFIYNPYNTSLFYVLFLSCIVKDFVMFNPEKCCINQRSYLQVPLWEFYTNVFRNAYNM